MSGAGQARGVARSRGGLARAFAALVEVRDSEVALVVLMLVHSGFAGVPMTLSLSAGNALFIEQHGARSLPFAYLAGTVFIPLMTLFCVRLQARLPFARFQAALVGAMIAGDVAMWLASYALDPKLGTLPMPVWAETEYSLSNLQFWGLAAQLFDVQQAKRLFGLVGTTGLAAAMLSGFALPGVIAVVGTRNVFLLSALFGVGSLVSLRRITRRFADRLESSSADQERRAGRPVRAGRGYASLVYALLGASFASFYVVDNLFYLRLERDLDTADRLASFLGVFLGSCTFVCLLFRGWLSMVVLRRFGVVVGILALPVLLFATTAAAAVAGALGVGAALLAALVLGRGLDYTLRESLDLQSVLLLYQPLPAGARATLKAKAEGIAGPIGGGAASALVLFLSTVLDWSLERLVLLAVAVTAGWAVIALRLRRAYRATLERALSRRQLEPMSIALDDAATRELLERGLHSKRPGEVLYCLALLGEAEPAALPRICSDLLGHEAPEVRREALHRIERRALRAALPAVAARLAVEPDPALRGLVLRVLGALGDEAGRDEVVARLHDAEPAVRAGALAGLLGSGSVERVLVAGQRLAELAGAAAPEERAFAARVLAEVSADGPHRLLLALLGDPEVTVRRAALAACAHRQDPRLWPVVVAALATPATRAAASSALLAAGAAAVPELAAACTATRDRDFLQRVARLCGRARGPRAERLLLDLLDDDDPGVRLAALAGLDACETERAGDATLARLRAALDEELDAALWTVAALCDLDRAEPPGLLARSLRRERALDRQRILLLLSLLHDRPALRKVRALHASPSPQRRALAVELADSVLPARLKRVVCPLLEDAEPEECARRLVRGQKPLGARGRLHEILERPMRLTGRWMKVCAIHAAALAGDADAAARVEDAAASLDPLVKETARWALARLTPSMVQPAKRGSGMLTIEKVMILKAVEIFVETPDELLPQLAGLLKEVEVPANETILHKGEHGDSLYIIVEGEVVAHDGDRVLRRMGERDIFGEMALLDAEPRSASVTAVVPTRLFRLDQEDFYDLMADRIEIVRGIIRVLCSRLRAK